MKAKLIGYIWTAGKGIALSELLTQLSQIKGKSISFGGFERLLYTGESGGYFTGLFLTIKDQRKTCEIQQSRGEYKIAVRELEDGSSLVDFNFFAINKETGRGLYQYYHNSCSLNQFCIFCRRQYDDLKEYQMQKDLAQSGGEDSSARAKRTVNAKYDGSLRWEVMVRTENLAKLLEELKKVNSFEFDFTMIQAKEPLFSPLANKVQRETHRLVFNTRVISDYSTIRTTIVDAVSRLNILKGRIRGKDFEGLDRTLRLMENPDSFGEYDYEELADEAVLNIEDISKSPFMVELLTVLDKHKELFGSTLS